MSNNKITKIFFLTFLLPYIAYANNNVVQQNKIMEKIMVIGNQKKAISASSSAHFISKNQLEKNEYSDINRVLKVIPGVILQEEEGYGNRPNISFRGGRSERSADINIMEDGILIAPAPYAAPSAYYFPRISRMDAVEVKTGSNSIKFGPRSTNGSVNLISSAIPQKKQGEIFTAYGSDETKRFKIKHGKTSGNFGYVLDFNHEATNGFKTIDKVGGNSGYDLSDYMAKFQFSSNPENEIYQSLEVKIGKTNETSHETYLGLTDEDFAANPYMRYAASQKDKMDANHEQLHLRHHIDFNKYDLTTTLYRNNFSRNWYKLQSITVAGATSKLGSALADSTYLTALKGDVDLAGDGNNKLTLKANNRDYYATGIESILQHKFKLGKYEHQLNSGVRYHADQEDRFQHEDSYSITSGEMNLTTSGNPGSNANREDSAKSYSAYIMDDIKAGKFSLTTGTRYEHIILTREDMSDISNNTENTIDVIVPAITIAYAHNDNLNYFTGIHKGFAPPSPGSTNEKAEESVNYETGFKFNKGKLHTAFTAFYHDYSNLLGNCTLSSGGDCTEGEQFNAGEVASKGIEFGLNYDFSGFLNLKTLNLPFSLNYSYNNAKFKNNFDSSFDEWGSVTKGDQLPYIPEHQYYISLALENDKFSLDISGKYTSKMRTIAGRGSVDKSQKTNQSFITDIALNYNISKKAKYFLAIDNIFDKVNIVARRPYGARPNKPRTILTGLKYKF